MSDGKRIEFTITAVCERTDGPVCMRSDVQEALENELEGLTVFYAQDPEEEQETEFTIAWTVQEEAMSAGEWEPPWEPRESPPRLCAICGGPIMRRTNAAAPIGMVDPRQPWLHVREEDWIDNPHEVEPEERVRTYDATGEPHDDVLRTKSGKVLTEADIQRLADEEGST